MASEKRLIDANKAVALMNQIETDSPFDDKEDILEKCVNILGICPTVDAVEVVRCKDCKHCTPDENIVGGYGDCFYKDDIHSIVNADDFCSYGERKDNE